MKRWICVIAACILLSVRVLAAEVTDAQAKMLGVDGLWDQMDGRTVELMRKYDPVVQADFAEGVGEIVADALGKSAGFIKTTLSMILRIIAAMVLCRLIASLGNEKAASAATLVGSLAITVCCITDLRSMIGLGQKTMEDISSFTTLLLPVLAAAATASGAVSGGSAIYAVTALFCNVLIRICRYLLVPLVYACLALGMADSALGENRLGKLRELVGWIIKTTLKGVLYLFTGFLAATGVISAAADASVLKAAKLAISGMVPVVGSIVSDASESLLASAGVLRSAVGTFGMLAVLAMFVLPFFQLGISYLGFKLTAAIGGLLESGQDKLLDTLTAAMGYLLAMVGSGTVMTLISCCCLIKVATG